MAQEPHILDYGPPVRWWQARVRRWEVVVAILIAVLVAWVLLMSQRVCYDNGWICADCGSRKSQTDWVFGFTTSVTLNQSALEGWLVQHDGSHVHDWRYIQGTGRNAFGQRISVGHGPAPAIYGVPPNVLDQFVLVASDDEIARFVKATQSGSRQEQNRVIDEVAARVLGDGRRPTRANGEASSTAEDAEARRGNPTEHPLCVPLRPLRWILRSHHPCAPMDNASSTSGSPPVARS